MANDVKWIKITTDMFDNRKIKHLRKLPDGNNIVLIWVMLLTMAGRCNAGGMIFLTENIPYTPQMLADELGFEVNTVLLALDALAKFNMIVNDAGFFKISGWEEYQNTGRLNEIREYNRLAQRRSRERRRLENVNDMSMTCQTCHETDKDIDKDKDKDIDIEIDKDKEKEKEKEKKINYSEILDLYHKTCLSYPKIRTLSDSRKKTIKARLKNHTIEEFSEVFRKAEESSFLKGDNDRNWSASFDWILKESNFVKILEGNYNNKPQKNKNSFNNFEPRQYDYDELERRLLSNNKPKASDDP